ncbi:MAG: hypothetical protein F7B59_08310 [Desulfurococcales archaeon]|nr:hypothetical protein [Desulfurococcales archaeon]
MGKRVTTISLTDETESLLRDIMSKYGWKMSEAIEESIKFFHSVANEKSYETPHVTVNATIMKVIPKEAREFSNCSRTIRSLEMQISSLKAKLSACNARQEKIVKFVGDKCPEALPEVAKVHYSSALSA